MLVKHFLIFQKLVVDASSHIIAIAIVKNNIGKVAITKVVSHTMTQICHLTVLKRMV